MTRDNIWKIINKEDASEQPTALVWPESEGIEYFYAFRFWSHQTISTACEILCSLCVQRPATYPKRNIRNMNQTSGTEPPP